MLPLWCPSPQDGDARNEALLVSSRPSIRPGLPWRRTLRPPLRRRGGTGEDGSLSTRKGLNTHGLLVRP